MSEGDAVQYRRGDLLSAIEKALACPDIEGFDAETTLDTGHNAKTVLTLAPAILDALEKKQISKFVVIAGCDAPSRSACRRHRRR